MTYMKKPSQVEYRSFTKAHYVFLVSFALLLLGGAILRMAWGITSVGEELIQSGIALVLAVGIAVLAHYFRLLDRFPREYPAIAAILTMAGMLFITFWDRSQTHIAFHREALILLAVFAVALTIYSSRSMGALGVALSLAAAFFCMFIASGEHDEHAGSTIILIALLLVTMGVVTKWFSKDALWMQLLTLAAAFITSFFLMSVLFPDTQYYIWESLYSDKVIPIPDIEWMDSNNPILSFKIMANAKLIGSSGTVFPLWDDLKWHLFNIIAFKGGWIALLASLLPVAGFITSGFALAMKHCGLRRFISFGVMTWAAVEMIGYVLFCFGINYWQARNVPLLSDGFFGNALLFIGLAVVLSTKREQCYCVQPGKLYRERKQFWNELPEWIFDAEEDAGPAVSLWIEDITDDFKAELRDFFRSDKMVKTIDLNKLEEAFPTAKNCAVFRCCSLNKHAGMPMLSFCLTRAHNFIKVIASPNTSMETILSLLQAYSYGCEKETDFCVEMDEAIDSESIEIFGVGM